MPIAPLLGLAAWNLYTLKQYGAMHLVVVSAERKQNIQHTLADLAARGLHFSSADTIISILTIVGLAVVPLAWHFLMPRRGAWAGAAAGGLAVAIMTSMRMELPVASQILLALGVTFGVRALLEAIAEKRWLPLVWIASVLLFQVITIFVGVRYLLPLLPGLILLIPGSLRLRSASTGLILSIAVAISVAFADANAAACYRDLAAKLRGRRFYFAGHWGFQFYAERAGGKLIDVTRPPLLQRGDVVVIAPRAFASPGAPRLVPGATMARVNVPCRSSWPLQTISCDAAASFYVNEVAGCPRYPLYLPFGFSRAPLEEFQLFVVK